MTDDREHSERETVPNHDFEHPDVIVVGEDVCDEARRFVASWDDYSRPAIAAPTRPVVKRGDLTAGSTTNMSFGSFLRRLLGGEDVIEQRLIRIEEKLDQLLQKETQEMADLSDLKAKVDAADTTMASAVTSITGLAAAIRSNANDPTALHALATSLDTETQALASAVTNNTAAANLSTSPGTPASQGGGTTGAPAGSGTGTPASGGTTGAPAGGGGTSGAPSGSGAPGGTPPASGSGTPATDPTKTATDTGPTA